MVGPTNDDPRVVPLTLDLRLAIAEQQAKLDAWQERTGRRTSYLFTHTEGRHEGEPIRDFVRSWHRTASIFKRYRIVNLADMQRAVARLAPNSNGSNRQLGPSPSESGKVRDQE